jgi:large subunit ribosomal protein L1
VEFRVDKHANLHVPIGKVSFPVENLLDNFATMVDAVVKSRPPGASGRYMKKIVVTSSMGPGIKVDPAEALAMEAVL